ncbi:MAG TPA: DUF1501 domain-containing protein [Tepidisphaeraceae bacterium]|nr:DUF1501 domain-containing protein [Tepidisphaeraceae bacterium]
MSIKNSNLTAIPGLPHRAAPASRRDFLASAGAGFGALAMAYLLGNEPLRAAEQVMAASPLAPHRPHFPATAKSVIFLFMEGGPSHLDLFDPKPRLIELAGQPLPASFPRPLTAMGEAGSPLLASKRKWKQHGQSGIWTSDWLPHISGVVDELAVIRSCYGEGINHSGGVCQMNTGSILAGRPSLGAWTTYGLGTENQNLPAFVVLADSNEKTINGPRNWGAGFMPAVYQGTKLRNGPVPITNLATPKGVGDSRQRQKLAFLETLDRRYAAARPDQSELEARIGSYELAFRMQAQAPEAIDLANESKATQQLYGMDNPTTQTFGRNCLLARRLVERGVRFVQLYHGAGNKWDAHSGLEKNHSTQCAQMDKPVAGLIRDLKSRGLLDQTLVIWGGEFGRTPMSEKGDGRDHNPYGFTMWMAGGGVKGGQTIGATDEVGLHAIESPLHVHDLHATLLSLMGLDHTRLIYFQKGRPERPTMNVGDVYRRITTG